MCEAGEQRTLWLKPCSEFEAFEEFVRADISKRDKSFTLQTLILDNIHAPSGCSDTLPAAGPNE